MRTPTEIESELIQLQVELNGLETSKKTLQTVSKYRDVQLKMFRLEREIAAAKGLQHAVPIYLKDPWRVSSNPVIHTTNSRLVIEYFCDSPGLQRRIEFEELTAMRIINISDEMFEAQELFGSGLDYSGLYEIANSKWERTVCERLEKVYAIRGWKITTVKHYALIFKEMTIECLSPGFEVGEQIRVGEIINEKPGQSGCL